MSYLQEIRKTMEQPVDSVEEDILRLIKQKKIINEIVDIVQKENELVDPVESEVSEQSFASQPEAEREQKDAMYKEANSVKKMITKTIKKKKAGERIGRQILAGKIVLPFAKTTSKAKRIIRDTKKEIEKQKLEDTSSDSEHEIILKALESDPEIQADDKDKSDGEKGDKPVNIFGPALGATPDVDQKPKEISQRDFDLIAQQTRSKLDIVRREHELVDQAKKESAEDLKRQDKIKQQQERDRQENAKQEKFKQERARQEKAKQEKFKQEKARQERLRQEEVKKEEAKHEEVKQPEAQIDSVGSSNLPQPSLVHQGGDFRQQAKRNRSKFGDRKEQQRKRFIEPAPEESEQREPDLRQVDGNFFTNAVGAIGSAAMAGLQAASHVKPLPLL